MIDNDSATVSMKGTARSTEIGDVVTFRRYRADGLARENLRSGVVAHIVGTGGVWVETPETPELHVFWDEIEENHSLSERHILNDGCRCVAHRAESTM